MLVKLTVLYACSIIYTTTHSIILQLENYLWPDEEVKNSYFSLICRAWPRTRPHPQKNCGCMAYRYEASSSIIYYRAYMHTHVQFSGMKTNHYCSYLHFVPGVEYRVAVPVQQQVFCFLRG